MRPIKDILQRFNKKDSSTAEEPDKRDSANLMKFIEDDTMKSLSKHLFAASEAMFSIATHMMTLQTLFSHPTEFARKHRESPEVQGFKQNPSRESMVAYVASQTLTHKDVLPQDGEGANVWDVLTQTLSQRPTPDTDAYWQGTEEDDAYDPQDDEEDYEVPPPRSRRHRSHVLDDEDDQAEDEEPFNTTESSGGHALSITQPDPSPSTSREPSAGLRREKLLSLGKDHTARAMCGRLSALPAPQPAIPPQPLLPLQREEVLLYMEEELGRPRHPVLGDVVEEPEQRQERLATNTSSLTEPR